jgi:hypothetical protein
MIPVQGVGPNITEFLQAVTMSGNGTFSMELIQNVWSLRTGLAKRVEAMTKRAARNR